MSEIRKAPASRVRQMSGCDASFIISLISNPILPPSGADGFPFPIVLTHANPFFHPFILPALETPEPARRDACDDIYEAIHVPCAHIWERKPSCVDGT